MNDENQSPAPKIREAEFRDAEEIARLHIRSWQAAYRGMMPDSLLDNLSLPNRITQWKKNLTERPESILVVEEAGAIAGWASFGPSRDDDARPETGEVFGLYFDPAFWRRGLGSLLYAEVEKCLRGEGFTESLIWVLKANARARGFYESIGYILDGVTRSVQREGVPEPEQPSAIEKILRTAKMARYLAST